MKSLEKSESRGTLFALSADIFWGLHPICWKLLQHVPAPEIVAHRIIWSFLFLVGVFLYHEPLLKTKLIIFLFIWAALIIYTAEGIIYLKKNEHLTEGENMRFSINMNMLLTPLFITGLLLSSCSSQIKEVPVKEFYEIQAVTMDGKTITLSEYTGKVLLIVNTASKCGFTGQYEGLQKLYDTYKERGLLILGFPANNFLKQEPGSNEEIKSFCEINFQVTFPLFEKISVKGRDQHPLYSYLTSKQTNPEFGGTISWNFNKFLISRDGKIINRFGSRTEPQDEKVINAIETALGE